MLEEVRFVIVDEAWGAMFHKACRDKEGKVGYEVLRQK